MSQSAIEVFRQRQQAISSLPYGVQSLGEKHLQMQAKLLETQVIPSQMSVKCVISTQDEDRSKDIVLTSGIDLTDHQRNPVVLLNHGFGSSGTDLPIAKACDPDGNYTVRLEEGRATAVSWFSQRMLEAEQVFQLIEEGILRGISIGFLPVEAEYRRDQGPEIMWPGLLISRSLLIEYSHVTIPDNPYALVDVLGKNRLAGKPIADVLMKSFQAMIPSVPGSPVVVAGLPGMGQVKKTVNNPVVGEKKAVTKTELQPLEGQDKPMDHTPKDVSPDVDPEPIQKDDRLPGAIALNEIHDELMATATRLQELCAKQENELVSQTLASTSESIWESMLAVEAAYAEVYPDLEPLSVPEDVIEPEEEVVIPDEPEQDEPVEQKKKSVVGRLKSMTAKVAAIRKRRLVQKKLSRSAGKVCLAAAEYLGEVSDHSGEMKASMKTAAGHHAKCLKDLAADTDDGEELKSLKAKLRKTEQVLSSVRDINLALRTEVKKLLDGR